MPLLPATPPDPDATPPPRPQHFDERYILPEHDPSMLLAKRNAHPMDARLVFLEEPHVYLFDGKPLRDSVTSVAHMCQEGFDRDAAVCMMRKSTKERWPRLKYVLDAREERVADDVTPRRGLLVTTTDGKTVAVARAGDFGDDVRGGDLVDAVMCTLVPTAKGCDGMQVFSFSRGMTDEEIFASWDANGLDKRNRGTEAHLQMQLYVEGKPFRADDEEVVVGRAFLDCFPADEWEGYRCEWEIVYEEADLAGSIDLVVRNRLTNKCIIVDYKRSDKLEGNLTGYRRMSAPLAHLDDCDGATYALQLSIYQHVLERVYGLDVEDRILVTLHPEKPYCTSVPYLHDEVAYLMARRRAEVHALRACPHRCPLTDVPLHTPVRVVGRDDVVDRKSALARGLRIVGDDVEMRGVVRRLIDETAVFPPVPAFPARWKTLMPKRGILPPVFAWVGEGVQRLEHIMK